MIDLFHTHFVEKFDIWYIAFLFMIGVAFYFGGW